MRRAERGVGCTPSRVERMAMRASVLRNAARSKSYQLVRNDSTQGGQRVPKARPLQATACKGGQVYPTVFP